MADWHSVFESEKQLDIFSETLGKTSSRNRVVVGPNLTGLKAQCRHNIEPNIKLKIKNLKTFTPLTFIAICLQVLRKSILLSLMLPKSSSQLDTMMKPQRNPFYV